MRPATQETVYEVLREFAFSQIPKMSKWNLADIRQGYPFHQLFFPEEAILAARVERSVVTSMGTKLYPALAEAIAGSRFRRVFVEHVVEGPVNDAAINMIEQIVTELRTSPSKRETPRQPDHEGELRDILNSRGGGQSTRAVTADIFIEDFDDCPLLIELKSPLPNLDIAAESKRKLLYYLTIMNRRGISTSKAFLGLTYNPHITRDQYNHPFTKRIMDMDKQVLIGSELWNYIGGPGTYASLLSLIERVRQELPDSTGM